MWSSRLFWKLFVVYVGLNLTLASGFLIVVTYSQSDEINRQVEQRLENTAVMLRAQVRTNLTEMLQEDDETPTRIESAKQLQLQIKQLASETQTRFTIIHQDGEVLADSEQDPAKMLNHANRLELIAASEAGLGTATRKSPTLGIDMFYVAVPITIQNAKIQSSDNQADTTAFVRVAERLDAIQERVSRVRRYILLFATIFGAIATGLTYAIVGRIIEPLSQLTQKAQAIAAGDDQTPVPVQSEDEIGVLAGTFNQMQSKLGKRFRQLRDNNEQMTTVLSSMDEGIIALDANEQIVLANNASKQLLDVAGDVIGRSILEVVRSRPLHEITAKCFETGRSVQSEFQSAGPLRRDLEVRATCLPGVPTPGIVLVLHDITELRRLENLRREFVANVSHELKTPLASIRAYAETLRLGALDDPENNVKFLHRIEEQADRLHQLILDMLQIARVESGEEAFEITSVPVGPVIDSCISQYVTSAKRKQIELVTVSPDSPIVVAADKDGVRAILDNLVSNAIKYTPAGGTVTVRWFRENDFAIIEVQDTGIGIDKENQSRVFERFYRVDLARSREMGGTGLGLSIVKHLSQSFGGGVDLASEVGEGCTFRVSLPCQGSSLIEA